MKNSKMLKKMIRYGLLGVMSVSLITGAGMPVNTAEASSYETVTETFDWGPSVSKVVVKFDQKVTAADLKSENFQAHVKRVLAEGAMSPSEYMANKQADKERVVLGSQSTSNKDLEGDRTITDVYFCDAQGKKAKHGEYVAIEMQVGPQVTLGAALNYDFRSGFNQPVQSEYTVTNKKNGEVVDDSMGDIRPQADKFKLGVAKAPGDRMSFPYASYEPKDNAKHPLIIWLHGMGEGGDTPSVPIMGNKATQFADASIQNYFGGAYVLAPQARTYWMQGHKSFADGTSVYSESLMGFIKDYVAKHPGVDASRIYVGGDSNGGYMTMLLVRDNPGYFAAAFPTCEGLADSLISEKDLKNIAQTPIWFTSAKTDTVLPPVKYAVPTVQRLQKIGADVHFSYFDKIVDQTGLYKKADGTPYEYMGHWSWIYVYNDQCEDTIGGKTVKLFQWMAQQHR